MSVRRPMLPILLLSAMLATGCRQSIREPEAYLRAALNDAVLLKDGPFEYKICQLSADYFLARELALSDSVLKPDRDSLRRVVEARHGSGLHYLLRIGLDSSSSGNAAFQQEMTQRMLLLQSQQERARAEITGICGSKDAVHPDLILVNSDWITRQSVSVLFIFKEEDIAGLTGLEFGKSFVRSRNLSVDAKSLIPNIRLKG